MRAAWAISLLSQAVLLAALWRTGRSDSWTAYLAIDLTRSLLLWALDWLSFSPRSPEYFIAWGISELAVGVSRILAALDASHQKSRDMGLIAASSALAWAAVLTPESFPVIFRASLMFYQGTVFAAFILLAMSALSGLRCDRWVLLYFSALAMRAVTLQAWRSQPEQIESVHLTTISVLFGCWLLSMLRGRDEQACLKT